jgi:hypothetical protein
MILFYATTVKKEYLINQFVLHALSKDAGENKNKLELSKILGATPETLSRTFKKLSNDKILTVEGRLITILDRKAIKVFQHNKSARLDLAQVFRRDHVSRAEGYKTISVFAGKKFAGVLAAAVGGGGVTDT